MSIQNYCLIELKSKEKLCYLNIKFFYEEIHLKFYPEGVNIDVEYLFPLIKMYTIYKIFEKLSPDADLF